MFFVVLIVISTTIGVFGEECIYDPQGLCMYRCPADTYSYAPGCTQIAVSQRTCRSPAPKPLGMICDYSRCDCYEPRVWDEAAKKCVSFDDCSDQSQVKGDIDF